MFRVERAETDGRWRLLESYLAKPEHVLQAVGAYFQMAFRAAFKEQGRPKGTWPPRMNPNLAGIYRDWKEGKRAPPRRRFEDRPAVIDNGDLRNSIAFNVEDEKTVKIGTRLPYAELQQMGGDSEAGPFTAEFQDWLRKWLMTKDGRPYRAKLGWLTSPNATDWVFKFKVTPRPFIKVLPEDKPYVLELLRRGFSQQALESGVS